MQRFPCTRITKPACDAKLLTPTTNRTATNRTAPKETPPFENSPLNWSWYFNWKADPTFLFNFRTHFPRFTLRRSQILSFPNHTLELHKCNHGCSGRSQQKDWCYCRWRWSVDLLFLGRPWLYRACRILGNLLGANHNHLFSAPQPQPNIKGKMLTSSFNCSLEALQLCEIYSDHYRQYWVLRPAKQ